MSQPPCSYGNSFSRSARCTRKPECTAEEVGETRHKRNISRERTKKERGKEVRMRLFAFVNSPYLQFFESQAFGSDVSGRVSVGTLYISLAIFSICYAQRLLADVFERSHVRWVEISFPAFSRNIYFLCEPAKVKWNGQEWDPSRRAG